jgi:tRNA nucleotidyltransferase (CCA-adding enzyme)
MRWIVYLLILTRQTDKQISDEVCKRLELPPRYSKIFCNDRFEADKCIYWLEQNLPIANSLLYKRLWEFRTELILYIMAASEQEKVKKAISHFFTKLRYIHTSIKGDDLIQMGLKPGPIFREIFEAVRDAKLDGAIRDRDDEIHFAEQYVRNLEPNSDKMKKCKNDFTGDFEWLTKREFSAECGPPGPCISETFTEPY